MANPTSAQNRPHQHKLSSQVHETQFFRVSSSRVSFKPKHKYVLQPPGREMQFSELNLGDEYKQVLETFQIRVSLN